VNPHGILESLNGAAYDACVPLHVSLELTLRCNLRCVHCYNFDRDRPRAVSEPELGFEEHRALLEDLRREGTLFLTLTGGEALLHARFWDLLELSGRMGFATSLLSNGIGLTPAVCARLAGHPHLWGVSVSLYGARPATHDAVTRVEGSWEATVAGARRLAERGVRIVLKYIVMKGNADEAGELIAWAESEGFEFVVDPALTGRYDGSSGSLAERVDPAQLEALHRGPLAFLAGKGEADPSDDVFKCNCARGNAAVSATGEVWPCISTPLKAGHVRELPFGRIWRESPEFRRIRGLKVADFRTCAPCGLKAWCRRSPGAAYLLTGDYTGVDPWSCEEAAILKRLHP
jgi:radical SAM protein with 4Fe4S-binding SPASM domain